VLMERFINFENIIDIETKLAENINLLEVAKGFCEFNYDKSEEVVALSSLLEIVLKNQRYIAEKVDSFAI